MIELVRDRLRVRGYGEDTEKFLEKLVDRHVMINFCARKRHVDPTFQITSNGQEVAPFRAPSTASLSASTFPG